MKLNETSRTYAYANISRVGADYVLTSRDFFVIVTDNEMESIKQNVAVLGKSLLLQNETLYVYKDDNYIVFELMKEGNFKRTLAVNINKL